MNFIGLPVKLNEKIMTGIFKREAGDQNPEGMIGACKSFEELYEVILSLGTIQGSKQTLSAEDVILAIGLVRNHKAEFKAITRTFGIREKVVELITG